MLILYHILLQGIFVNVLLEITKRVLINYEGGMGDLRGGPKIFLHRKGGYLKCFQNTEMRT